MTQESELILNKAGFPPLSARGCTQQLMPIESGSFHRTINGRLIYAGKAIAHKYRSIIFCEDKSCIALDGFWRGSDLRVGCIQRLWQKVSEIKTILDRDPIEKSVFIISPHEEAREILSVSGRDIILENDVLPETYVSYRPWLDMKIMNFSFMTNEWGLKVGWQLELEEV